jgi:hypothetical protein
MIIWQNAIHSRAANHFNLYSEFLPFQSFFVIAHRNFVSTYDFALKCWGETY